MKNPPLAFRLLGVFSCAQQRISAAQIGPDARKQFPQKREQDPFGRLGQVPEERLEVGVAFLAGLLFVGTYDLKPGGKPPRCEDEVARVAIDFLVNDWVYHANQFEEGEILQVDFVSYDRHRPIDPIHEQLESPEVGYESLDVDLPECSEIVLEFLPFVRVHEQTVLVTDGVKPPLELRREQRILNVREGDLVREEFLEEFPGGLPAVFACVLAQEFDERIPLERADVGQLRKLRHTPNHFEQSIQFELLHAVHVVQQNRNS